MNIGDQINVAPVELVAGGAALARVDGLPIFAVNIFPGDVAVVRVTEVKKGFARADLVRLVEPSPLRRVAPCPVANECGGCDWTALRLDAQLQAKERILRESLRRIGKIFDPPPIAIHPSALNYRIRSRLHSDGRAVGFYAMGSNGVVPLPRECEVVGVRTALECGGSPPPSAGEKEIWEVNGQLITEGELTIDGYVLSTEAFFQVNRHLLGTMLELVSAHAGRVRQKRVAIDLFAGVGFFSRPLTELFERVIAVEGSRVSFAYARRNAPAAECVNEPVERWVQRMPRADFVFLDPPRAGARPEVIAAAGSRAAERVAYLSCDPVTFSRDANRLIASGWRLASLDLLDLFPNTHHVETLASFEREG